MFHYLNEPADLVQCAELRLLQDVCQAVAVDAAHSLLVNEAHQGDDPVRHLALPVREVLQLRALQLCDLRFRKVVVEVIQPVG